VLRGADARAEYPRDARARAWAFVFDCHRRRKDEGGTATAPEDAKGRSKHDSRAGNSIQE
jgi:hypothetical protein